jgi:hypothetical protein
LLRAPRTEPYVQLSRIRLPPWVFDGEALARPWMKYAWFWKPAISQTIERSPSGVVALTAAAKRTKPVPQDNPPELAQGSAVVRHGVIGEVAAHDRPKPRALLVQWSVPVLPERISDLVQLGTHAVASAAPA